MKTSNLPLWDLTPIYKSIDDARIKNDLKIVKTLCADFASKYKEQLNQKLNLALTDIIKIDEITSTLMAYCYLLSSRDAMNQELKSKISTIQETLTTNLSQLTFFDIELGKMEKSYYESQIKKSPLLQKNIAYMDKIRKNAKYQLTEPEETMLTELSPFLSSEWDDMMDELETNLNFKMGFKKLTLTEILHISNTSKSSKKRNSLLTQINKVLLNSNYLAIRARSLNLTIAEKQTLDKKRGLTHDMQARNISNNIDDKTVTQLHNSVIKYGSIEAKRYYTILKKLIKKNTLQWSDRNAPLPFENNKKIDWETGLNITLESYKQFSPTLANIISENIENNRIDAPPYKGKTSGAYNYTMVTNGGKTYTWTFLNYMGSIRDIMTISHELGHAVHGQLAGENLGTLGAHAPMAYAETASIFGEMLTFEYLLSQTTDKIQKLTLLLNKSNDWINSVVRQISFSLFEQEIHKKRKTGKLTPSDFNEIWITCTKKLYGEDGELFTYSNMENLWSYVGHFMRPFYVYAYAFGELFTSSLFANRERIKNFETLYIDMLKSGGTKSASELTKPFGLNPTDEDFWEQGIKNSISKWLDEAEKIMHELKI